MDVETLRKVNADIILSINEVVKIHEEGSKRRAEAQEELARIEDELNRHCWKPATDKRDENTFSSGRFAKQPLIFVTKL